MLINLSIKHLKLKTKDLSQKCNPAIFKFESTADVKPLSGIIGQSRAVKAMEFGLDIEGPGYNIYLSGAFGTGRTSLAKELLNKKAKSKKIPTDWIYLFNFKSPDEPVALSLPAGFGKKVKMELATLIENIMKEITKTFDSEDFDLKKTEALSQFVEETNEAYLKLEEKARAYGFSISKTQNGLTSIPLKDGESLNQDDYIAMPEEDRAELMKKSTIVQEKINEVFRVYKDKEKQLKETIKELEILTAQKVIKPSFIDLAKKCQKYPELLEYFNDIQLDMIDKLDYFLDKDNNALTMQLFKKNDKKHYLRKYQVNLFVDNSDLEQAPVIFESNPSYANLFGQIEYESEFGTLSTDFTKLKAGSLHKANGGYLLLYASDIFKNYYVWDTLKRVLKNQEIIVESLSKYFGINNSETLQAEAIPLNLKVIIIGEPSYYYLLYLQDEEFQKLFKIRADFDVEIDKNKKHVLQYASLIASVCEKNGLKHFTAEATASIVDYGSKIADSQDKLTTHFNKIVDIIYEANIYADYENKKLVEAKHVQEAIDEKRKRSAMLEEKIYELIEDELLMIDVSGEKIGEINGLAVYDPGDHSFGKPVRITAKTFMGERGIINIEREVRMSGSIHSKGVLTLNGYLGAQYAQDHTLSLSASLTFEQSYSGIEGDSASTAELYAIISSLADLPLKQGIAVTGSVNQNGEVQPVGGVNQKIEGFFRVCKLKGLDASQGVIIPRQNVSQLTLNQEVIDAVSNKLFNIYAVGHVNEGLEILTGIKAGEKNEDNIFEKDSIHDRVKSKLNNWNKKKQEKPKQNMLNTPRQVLLRRRSR